MTFNKQAFIKHYGWPFVAALKTEFAITALLFLACSVSPWGWSSIAECALYAMAYILVPFSILIYTKAETFYEQTYLTAIPIGIQMCHYRTSRTSLHSYLHIQHDIHRVGAVEVTSRHIFLMGDIVTKKNYTIWGPTRTTKQSSIIIPHVFGSTADTIEFIRKKWPKVIVVIS